MRSPARDSPDAYSTLLAPALPLAVTAFGHNDMHLAAHLVARMGAIYHIPPHLQIAARGRRAGLGMRVPRAHDAGVVRLVTGASAFPHLQVGLGQLA